MRTDAVMYISKTDTGLTPGSAGRGAAGAGFVAIGANRFRAPNGEAVFSGERGRRRMEIVRAASDTSHLEEVQPAPATIPVAEYVGTYASDELDVRLVVAVANGKLVIRRRPADVSELRPAYLDDFTAPGVGTIRFARDAKGKVTGFGIFAGRVLDVRFRKVE
jgi:hypothetical protein